MSKIRVEKIEIGEFYQPQPMYITFFFWLLLHNSEQYILDIIKKKVISKKNGH